MVEGFYGQPWNQSERLELFERLSACGLNTYLYAPKDDLKQRALWRELYSKEETQNLKVLIETCRNKKVRFFYALSSGLDVTYADKMDLELIKGRFQQLIEIGCGDFALLFDDIPDAMKASDQKRFGSFASAQAHLANELFSWTRYRMRLHDSYSVPRRYCGRMVRAGIGGKDYLSILGRELEEEIEVFWTGPEIISKEITLPHIQEISDFLQRKPLIWDNLHANDYDGSRFFCGPYSGRSPEIKPAVGGILMNPNNEFPLNYVPLWTFGEFVSGRNERNPREAYLVGMKQWLQNFQMVSQSISLDDLVLLGDCYYLPHEDGENAKNIFECAKRLIQKKMTECDSAVGESFIEQAGRLKNICSRLIELRDRPLFYALSRKIWDLREELDLLLGYVNHRASTPDKITWNSDSHLPGTYRGGFVRKLQTLLKQQSDGSLSSEPLINRD